MDPASILVAALVAGAAAALKPTAENAVKDLYAGVKQLMQDRYADIRLARLEKDPTDPTRQAALKQDIQDCGADKDADLLARVNALLAAIEHDQSANAAAQTAGIQIAEVKAAGLKLHDITAAGGVSVGVRQSEFAGDIEISGLHAGAGQGAHPN